MDYRDKTPHRYDKNSQEFLKGAHRNQRGQRATESDRFFLSQRPTKYHRFTEPL